MCTVLKKNKKCHFDPISLPVVLFYTIRSKTLNALFTVFRHLIHLLTVEELLTWNVYPKAGTWGPPDSRRFKVMPSSRTEEPLIK